MEQVYVLLDGAVKISSISPDGKVYTYGILGARRLNPEPDRRTDTLSNTGDGLRG